MKPILSYRLTFEENGESLAGNRMADGIKIERKYSVFSASLLQR